MAIEVTKATRLPAGTHQGIISAAHMTQKTFRPEEGPQSVLEVVIQPAPVDGVDVEPLGVIFNPVINGLSALSGLLENLGMHPAEGETFEESALDGIEVVFEAKENANGFMTIQKDTIKRQ